MKNLLDKYRKEPLNKTSLEFLSSIKEDMWILEEDVIGSIAHVTMLMEQNIITREESSLILNELLAILASIRSGDFQINTDSYEDIHPYIENLVIKKTGIECGGKIHSARSRNDQVALDIRLKVRKELIGVLEMLLKLVNSLLELAEKSKNYYIPLYTHFQRAQLGIYSQYPLCYSFQIIRICQTLIHNFDEINFNPLGACAIGGTSFPINRDRTSELLGLNGLIFNSIDAVSSKDHLIHVLMNLTLIANCFSRIAEDFIIFSSQEFKFVEIDDKHSSVSSAMPQKKNPDTLELLKGKMGRIFAGLNQFLFITKGISSGYSRDFQEIKRPLIESFNTIKSSGKILIEIIDTVKLLPENMVSAVNNSMILAIDLAEFLSINSDLSFRESHSIVGSLVNKFGTWEKIINKNNIIQTVKDITNKTITLEEEKLQDFQNFEVILSNKKSLGSPNKDNVNFSIQEIKNKNKKISEIIAHLSNKIQDSERILIETAKKITNT